MNWRAIRTIYGKEMRDSLRDYRTIISMIVIPTLGIPLLIFSHECFCRFCPAKRRLRAVRHAPRC